jgi:hypothetical protein
MAITAGVALFIAFLVGGAFVAIVLLMAALQYAMHAPP